MQCIQFLDRLSQGREVSGRYNTKQGRILHKGVIKNLELSERFISAVNTTYSTQHNQRAADTSAKGMKASASSINHLRTEGTVRAWARQAGQRGRRNAIT